MIGNTDTLRHYAACISADILLVFAGKVYPKAVVLKHFQPMLGASNRQALFENSR